jgi:hypothetical protein
VTVDNSKLTEIYFDNIPDEVREVKLSDLFSDFQIIPLETKPECLIGSPTIKLSDNYIFVGSQILSDPARLFRFDMNGYFINEIGSGGRGPNEHVGYFLGQTLPIDDDSTIIVTWQGFGEHPHIYHYNGTFIEKVIKPMKLIGNIYRWSNDVWFSTGKCAGIPEYPRDSIKLVFYDNKGTILETIPRLKYPGQKSNSYTPWAGATTVYRLNGQWKLFQSGIDTIFRIINKKLVPSEILNRGKDGMPYNSFIDISSLEGKYEIEILAETENLFIIQKVIQRDVNATQYQPGKWNVRSNPDYQLIIIDKINNSVFNAKLTDDVFHLIPDDLLNSRLEWLNTSRVFISLEAINYLSIIKGIEPQANISKDMKSQFSRLTNITQDSNPIILTFGLKDKIRIN